MNKLIFTKIVCTFNILESTICFWIGIYFLASFIYFNSRLLYLWYSLKLFIRYKTRQRFNCFLDLLWLFFRTIFFFYLDWWLFLGVYHCTLNTKKHLLNCISIFFESILFVEHYHALLLLPMQEKFSGGSTTRFNSTSTASRFVTTTIAMQRRWLYLPSFFGCHSSPHLLPQDNSSQHYFLL